MGPCLINVNRHESVVEQKNKTNRTRRVSSMKCNNTEGVEGVRSMKVSVKVKVFCYVLMNFGILGFSAIWMNLLFWFLFRLRDKGSL